LLALGRPLAGRVLLIDALNTGFKEIEVKRDAACPLCGENPTMTELHTTPAACAAPQKVAEISAEQLKKEMASATPPFLLAVRNQDEFDERRIPASVLIPLPQLADRYAELDPNREMVVHCKSGGRSSRAIQFLQTKGFTKMRNLAGGIMGY